MGLVLGFRILHCLGSISCSNINRCSRQIRWGRGAVVEEEEEEEGILPIAILGKDSEKIFSKKSSSRRRSSDRKPGLELLLRPHRLQDRSRCGRPLPGSNCSSSSSKKLLQRPPQE